MGTAPGPRARHAVGWNHHPEVLKPVSKAPIAPLLLLGTGLVLALVGTFLPWLVSGEVRRNSYAVAGIADRVLIPDGHALAWLVSGWSFAAPALVLPAAVGALRWWRTAAVVALVVTTVTGVVAAMVLSLGSAPGLVSPDPLGPAVTLGGSLLAFGSGVTVLLRSRRRRTRPGPEHFR